MNTSKKKVLYITYDGLTDPLGQSQVLPYLVGLSKYGYEFTILSFEKKHRYSQVKNTITAITEKAGIRWVPMTFTAKPPVLAKLYDAYRIRKKTFQLHQEYGFDMLHCRSYVPAIAGMALYKKLGIPFLFDMRGFWVDERVDAGQWNLKNPVFRNAYRIYKKKEIELFKQAAHIISLTYKGKKELEENFKVPAGKITVIPCCVDLAHFDYSGIDSLAKEKLSSELGIKPGEKLLSYLGSLGGWYMTDEMLDFYKILESRIPGTKFLFISHNSKEEIYSKARERGIGTENIILFPAQRKEVPLLLSLSDWSIFFIKDVYSKKASSPTKQGEIMAMGIPVICNDIGDTGDFVKSSGAGWVIDGFSTSAYENLVTRMKSDQPTGREKIRESAREFFNLDTAILQYKNVYEGLNQPARNMSIV